MNNYVDVMGKTVEEAIADGLERLSLDRDDVSVEVLEMNKAGFLGMGGAPAIVRLSYQGDAIEGVTSSLADLPAPEVKAEQPRSAPKSAPAFSLDAVNRAEEFLQGMMVKMNLNVAIERVERDEGIYQFNIIGSEAGALIGRGGETLEAIQHIVSQVGNQGEKDRTRISVDAEGYRKRKEDVTAATARRAADKALRYGKNFALEPMNSFDRHVVHTALQGVEGVTTTSLGYGPQRFVVVLNEAAGQPAETYSVLHGQNQDRGGYSRGRGTARPYRN